MLVAEGHEQRAPHPGLQVLLGDITRPAVKHRRQLRLEGIHHRGDLNHIHADAQRRGERLRVLGAPRLGEHRRHGHAAHALGAKRVHRDGRGERRVDATGQPDDDPGKSVRAHVIAYTLHQSTPQLALGAGDRRHVRRRPRGSRHCGCNGHRVWLGERRKAAHERFAQAPGRRQVEVEVCDQQVCVEYRRTGDHLAA